MVDLSEKYEIIEDKERAAGLVHELDWWRDWVADDNVIKSWLGPSPNPDLQIEVELFLKGLAGGARPTEGPLEVLDLGSGPISIFSNNFDNRVSLTAADPLAEGYRGLIDDARTQHLCRPIYAEGERLVHTFGPRRFDACHIRNAIDHARDPILVIYNMILCTKPGGFILLHGFENEGTTVGGVGLHQWDIYYDDRGLIVERIGSGNKVMVEEQFAGILCPVKRWTSQMYGRRWFNFIAQVL
jgi:SAM-dependent methyltransferase